MTGPGVTGTGSAAGPDPGTVPEAGFWALAGAVPDRPAVVDASGVMVPYGALAARARRLAGGLRAAGLAEGDTLVLVMPNGADLAALYAAAVASGLRIVLVNWHLTGEEMAYIVTDSQARALVAHGRFGSAAAAAAEPVPPERRFSVGPVPGFRPLEELEGGPEGDGAAAGGPVPEVAAGMVMFYTSGTTGRPKGVVKRVPAVPPGQVGLSSGIGLAPPPLETALESREVSLIGGPLYHAAPLAGLAMGLDAGATVVLMDRWTPEGFLALVARHRVTYASMVPTMFHRLLSLPDEVRRSADVSSLRAVMHAGAPCPVEVKRRMIEWWGPIITEAYSSTEGAGTTVSSEEWLARPGTVGRPGPGVTLRILDDEGRECPPGVPGRVYLSQALWEFEYHGDAEKTAAARVGGLFTVGDIGYVDRDGYLFLCDRVADVVVSGGVNIYPAEVEAVLLSHPAVADAAVVGAPNDEWGEEVRAVVEPAEGAAASPELARDLIAFCRDRLAHYKCPAAVDFVDSLGRDPNGKVRKGAIRARYWEGRDRRI